MGKFKGYWIRIAGIQPGHSATWEFPNMGELEYREMQNEITEVAQRHGGKLENVEPK